MVYLYVDVVLAEAVAKQISNYMTLLSVVTQNLYDFAPREM
jgi:hypothetical protein